MFHVIDLETKVPWPNAEMPETYPSGALASERALILSEAMGRKFQPRRVQCADWETREAARFADGTYKRVPWDDGGEYSWFRRYMNNETRKHYAHVSAKVSGCIAFTESAEKGAADVQTPMKVGRYLARFYRQLDAAQIKAFANEFLALFGTAELRFAKTADDIENVYLTGPSSCMSYAADKYSSPFHPVRVYAAGDIELAYLVVKDGKEEAITGRALCWPAKKLYSRVYGDEKLHTMLKELGFTKGNLDGAKLTKHMHRGSYVVPYIDGSCAAEDAGDHLIIQECGGISGEQTNGLADETERAICANCLRRYDLENDEGGYVESHEEYWCSQCYENETFYCDRTGYTCAGDSVRMANGETWSQDAFAVYGFVCEGNGRNYPNEERVMLQDGTLWSQNYFDHNGHTCSHCGECFAQGDNCGDCPDDTEEMANPELVNTSSSIGHVPRQGVDRTRAPIELPLGGYLQEALWSV